MSFSYRIGMPFWKTVAKLGVPLVLSGKAFYDNEAKVWVATSDDFGSDRPFVCESETKEELDQEIENMALDMLDCIFESDEKKVVHSQYSVHPDFCYAAV